MFQAHRFVSKEECRHDFDIVDNRSEAHLIEDVFLKIDARCNFNQFHAFRRQFKDGSLRNVQHGLSDRIGIIAAEGDLFDLFQELMVMSLLIDDPISRPEPTLSAAGREGSAVNDFFRVLRNVDETAAAGNTAFELADIDIAVLIASARPKIARSTPPAIVKVKLVGLIDE